MALELRPLSYSPNSGGVHLAWLSAWFSFLLWGVGGGPSGVVSTL